MVEISVLILQPFYPLDYLIAYVRDLLRVGKRTGALKQGEHLEGAVSVGEIANGVARAVGVVEAADTGVVKICHPEDHIVGVHFVKTAYSIGDILARCLFKLRPFQGVLRIIYCLVVGFDVEHILSNRTLTR